MELIRSFLEFVTYAHFFLLCLFFLLRSYMDFALPRNNVDAIADFFFVMLIYASAGASGRAGGGAGSRASVTP